MSVTLEEKKGYARIRTIPKELVAAVDLGLRRLGFAIGRPEAQEPKSTVS